MDRLTKGETMATKVTIAGSDGTAKIRSPLGVVALTLVTFGIYGLFWWYFVNREMRDFGKAKGTDECGTSPGTSLAALAIGWVVIVPPFISIFKGFKRMNKANELAGSGDGFDAGLGLLLWLFISPIGIYLFQANLNKVWETSGSAVGGGSSAAIDAGQQAAAQPQAPQQVDSPSTDS